MNQWIVHAAIKILINKVLLPFVWSLIYLMQDKAAPKYFFTYLWKMTCYANTSKQSSHIYLSLSYTKIIKHQYCHHMEDMGTYKVVMSIERRLVLVVKVSLSYRQPDFLIVHLELPPHVTYPALVLFVCSETILLPIT